MEKKFRNVMLAAVIAFVILVVGIVVLLVRVNKIWDLVGDGSISFNNSQAANDPEAPSILSDSNIDYAGKDTLSLEDGTIAMRASVTPLEFKEGTKARIKINGKSYNLKRKDNTFAGTFRVSAFEKAEPVTLILKDGDTVRTEELMDGEVYPFLPCDFTWSFDGNSPKIDKDKIVFENRMTLSNGRDEDAPFSTAQILGTVDGKSIYKKDFKLGKMSADSTDVSFDWEDEISVPSGKTLTVYLVTKDKYGFVYRYNFGQVRQRDKGATFGTQELQKLEVLNPKGKVLFSKKANDTEEE